jgi:hypothetical protein
VSKHAEEIGFDQFIYVCLLATFEKQLNCKANAPNLTAAEEHGLLFHVSGRPMLCRLSISLELDVYACGLREGLHAQLCGQRSTLLFRIHRILAGCTVMRLPVLIEAQFVRDLWKFQFPVSRDHQTWNDPPSSSVNCLVPAPFAVNSCA